MAYRKCEGCGKKYPSKQWRREQILGVPEQILGVQFFLVLELRDLGDRQRKDVEFCARFCSDECADAGRVEMALEKTK